MLPAGGAVEIVGVDGVSVPATGVDGWVVLLTVGCGTAVADPRGPDSQANPISKNAATAAPIKSRCMPIAVRPMRVVADCRSPDAFLIPYRLYAGGSVCGSVLYRFIAMLIPSVSRHSTASAARSMVAFTVGCSSSENRPRT